MRSLLLNDYERVHEPAGVQFGGSGVVFDIYYVADVEDVKAAIFVDSTSVST